MLPRAVAEKGTVDTPTVCTDTQLHFLAVDLDWQRLRLERSTSTATAQGTGKAEELEQGAGKTRPAESWVAPDL